MWSSEQEKVNPCSALEHQLHISGSPAYTNKKELVGNFRNPGRAWNDRPTDVKDHDFPSEADGRAVPYGIYDLLANRGRICVGQSADTPAFAVDCIESWWRHEGRSRYPDASELVILADSGGSNRCAPRAWKYNLQHTLCNPHDLTVSVVHYPSGCSKWNPIEHRVFSEISKNWAARPLDSFATILHYIRTTVTQTGLRLQAQLVEQTYETGVKITPEQMAALNLTKAQHSPKWNYSSSPLRN